MTHDPYPDVEEYGDDYQTDDEFEDAERRAQERIDEEREQDIVAFDGFEHLTPEGYD